jgi:undecaprenyl-diphosphatase
VALLTLLLLRKGWLTISMIIWALIVGYSRIYLGVHYPGDVVFGSLLGTLTGWGGYELFTFIDRKYLGRQKEFPS